MERFLYPHRSAMNAIRLLESIISRLTTSKISKFRVVSVVEQARLNLTFSKPPKTGFLGMRPKYDQNASYGCYKEGHLNSFKLEAREREQPFMNVSHPYLVCLDQPQHMIFNNVVF